MKTGNIPEKLKFFIRPAEEVKWCWDDVEGGEISNKVYPCYVSDAENKKTCETGLSWAQQARYDYKTKDRIALKYQTLEIDNKPFKNLRIITLEIRDKGGRAYKVCADIGDRTNLYFDLREDCLLDSIFKTGIQINGLLPGEFIFARVGAQMKPVRVGSYLYDKMVEATKYDETKPIEDLVVGGIYKNKRGDEAVFLGKYWARDPEIEFIEWQNNWNWGYRDKQIKTIVLGKPSLHYVFANNWTHHTYGENKRTDEWFHSEDDSGYNKYYLKGDPVCRWLTMVKKHSFKEKTGQISVPEGYIEKIKDFQIKTYNKPDYLKNYPLMSVSGLFAQESKLLTLSADRGYVHPLLEKFTHK